MTAIQLTRAAALSTYAEVAQALGLNPVQMVTAQDLPLACLSEPELKVSFQAVSRLLEASASLSETPDFGLRLMGSRRYPHLGLLGLAAREQATVRDAVIKFVDQAWVQTDGFSLSLEEFGDVATVVMRTTGRKAAGRQITELFIGIVVHTLRSLIDDSWRPEAVLSSWPPPDNPATHVRVLRARPEFFHETDGVALLARDLDRPLLKADPMVARALGHYLPAADLKPAADLTQAVRAVVVSTLPNGRCSTATVAARLGIDKRTLHRRLAARNQTFSAVVDQVRKDLLEKHIGEELRSLTQISEMLGFASLSAFSRWRRTREAAAAGAPENVPDHGKRRA